MKLEIEKNIPMPTSKNSEITSVLREMLVGDSILVKDIKPMIISASMDYVKRKTSFQFSRRATDGGYRVWRIK